jgi:hypothetical protein
VLEVFLAKKVIFALSYNKQKFINDAYFNRINIFIKIFEPREMSSNFFFFFLKKKCELKFKKKCEFKKFRGNMQS